MIERYTLAEMKELWSELSKYNTWLDVEVAAAESMAELGIVPAEEIEKLKQKLPLRLDPDRIEAIEQETRHDVIAFLLHVEELAGPPARFLHYGMTSYDVVDTALALRLKKASELILDRFEYVLDVLKRRAFEFEHTPLIGRSHGIHAEPVSFGVVLARWYAELSRCKVRFERAADEVATGKLSGAVGVFGSLPPQVEEKTMARLGIQAEPAASQVVPRDRHAAFFSELAILGSVIEDIAINLRHMQRTEVAEIEESFAKGQRGSSAMPHKKNPISAENLTGIARMLRGYALPALENVPLWHERDISHSSVERIIAPDATTLAHYGLNRLGRLIENMKVNTERMMQNLELTGGLVFSEKVLLALVSKGLARGDAYKIVQRCAMQAANEHKPFMEVLEQDDELRSYLDENEIEACFDMEHHLQHVSYIFERVFGKEEQ